MKGDRDLYSLRWVGSFFGLCPVLRQTKGSFVMAETKTAQDNKKASVDPHAPAKHIEEIARLASSVEKTKDLSKVLDDKD